MAAIYGARLNGFALRSEIKSNRSIAHGLDALPAALIPDFFYTKVKSNIFC